MRTTLLTLLFVAGCHQDAPTRDEYVTEGRSLLAAWVEIHGLKAGLGAPNPNDATEPTKLGRIEQLEAENAALRTKVATLEGAVAKGTSDTTAALAAAKAYTDAVVAGVKALHLIAPGDEDLGLYLGDDVSWYPKVGAPIAWDHRVTLEYDGANCTGGPFIKPDLSSKGTPPRNTLAIGPNGSLWKPDGPSVSFSALSQRSFYMGKDQCFDRGGAAQSYVGFPAVDMSIPVATHPRIDLGVELR